VSQLDGACNIPEAYAIAKLVPQQQRTSRVSPWQRSYWLLLSLLVALFFAPLPAPAQLYTGSVTGAFTATTDNTGRYLLRSIPPGTYTITAEAAADGR
jgi:hypothetical protein